MPDFVIHFTASRCMKRAAFVEAHAGVAAVRGTKSLLCHVSNSEISAPASDGRRPRTRFLWSGLLLAIVAALPGCGVVRSNQIASMAPGELAAATDRDVCRGLLFNRNNANLLFEANRRKLGDCSQDHFLCVSWGAAPGSPEYVKCRTNLLAASRAAPPAPAQPIQDKPKYCTPTGATAGVTMICQ